MKRSAHSKNIPHTPLFKRTLKSYSARERGISAGFLIVLIFSGWNLLGGKLGSNDVGDLFNSGTNYNEGLVGEITRLNPVYADLSEVDQDITSLIFEGLAKYDQEQDKVVENIATHTLDENKTTYTFVLKDGMTWHDGQPITAEDVYFTFHDVIQHPEFENPLLKESFSGVEIELIDEKTVTMTLKEANAFFFTQLTVGILPKHLLGEIPITELDTNEFNQEPIGNGPYRVTGPYERESDGTMSVELAYYDEYWQNSNPEIQRINFISFPTFEALLEEKGQLHGIARVPAYRLAEIDDERFVQNEYTLPQYTALFMETDDERLTKRNIRLGIQKAIDKNAILEAIGYGEAVDTPLLELNQEDWINQSNPTEAAGAFFDEGWILNEEKGWRTNEEGDEILSFTLVRRSYPTNEKLEEVTKTTAEMIAAQLGAVGVMVTVESYEGDTFQTKVANREYDLLLYGQSLGYNLDTYSYWHSSQANSGLNLSNYGNAKADFYIEALRSTFDDETDLRQEYLESLGGIINQDIPAVFLYRPTYYYLVDERFETGEIKNLLFPLDRFGNILSWQ